MKTFAVTPVLAAVLLATGCTAAPQGAPSPATATTSATPPITGTTSPQRTSPQPTAEPSPTASPSSTGSPTGTPTAQQDLGKPIAFLDPADYTSGVLPDRWSGGAGWRVGLLDEGAEVLSTLAAYTEHTPEGERNLVLTDSAGTITYRSPSLGLDPEQSIEPYLGRVVHNGQEFLAYYQIGIPLRPVAGEDAGNTVARLLIVDVSGTVTEVEEDVTHYRPVDFSALGEALVLTATDGGLEMHRDPVRNIHNTEYVRVLDPETATLEQIPELEGHTWLRRIDGVDVFRTPGSEDPQQGAMIGTRDWSTNFADRPTNGSVVFGPTFITVERLDNTCEVLDLRTGEPLEFQGALKNCAYPGGNLHSYDSATSPDGRLVLMRWTDEQNVESRWIVDLATGEQRQIDPAYHFHPTVISNSGKAYGTSTDGRTGQLDFPDRMDVQFDEVAVDVPSAITDGGLGMFKDEFLPGFFGVAVR